MQCKDCEFSKVTSTGKRIFLCDPFENIVESQCIIKWQLIKIDQLLDAQSRQLRSQVSMAPLQSKIMKYIEREIQDLEDSDDWKLKDRDEFDDLEL